MKPLKTLIATIKNLPGLSLNAIKLSGNPPFLKGGRGISAAKIPLNPPLKKGEINVSALNLMALGLSLHILLTHEDGVIVARCLDFSVSSHGENEEEALASLSDSMADYLDHASKQGTYHEIIDPDEEEFWNLFKMTK